MFELIKKLNVTHICEHVLMGAVAGAGASIYASIKSGQPVTKDSLIAAGASGLFLGAKNVIDQNKANASIAPIVKEGTVLPPPTPARPGAALTPAP